MLKTFLILINIQFILSISSADIYKSNTTKKLPNAIIIGAKKCGTRALLKFIGAHEHVSAAGAEVHFFDRYYDRGLDWYR
jgi:hypothetical protein